MNEVVQGTGAPEAPAQAQPVVETNAPGSAPEGNAGQQSEPKERDGTRSLVSRVGHVTRQKEAAIREAAQWRERAEALERQYTQQSGTPQPQQRESQTDMTQVMATARQQAAFDLKCNEVASKGKTIPGFTEALQSLGALGVEQPQLEVIIDSDDAPAVIAYLGTHLDEAADILAKPPAAMARALAKLEATLGTQPAVSSAPRPLQPNRGKGPDAGPPIGSREWFESENKRDAERRKR